MNNLVVSVSPHIKKAITVDKIMWAVILALIPALFGGIYLFGLGALLVVLVCVITAVLAELVIQKYCQKRTTILDGSAAITGLLLGMSLPPTVPLWIPIIGAIVAIGVAKHAFGGLGHNIFNPALIGRAFLLASWPVIMTTWISPFDGVTQATPLGFSKMQGIPAIVSQFGGDLILYSKVFLGTVGGSIGETSALLLFIGAAFLFYKKIITWHTPVAYIGMVGLLSYALGVNPLFYMLSGGLILGAFFMATDYVTTPLTDRGKIVFGIGCGILTMVIRLYSGLPEGITFSILIMNGFTPIIDRFTKPQIFGTKK